MSACNDSICYLHTRTRGCAQVSGEVRRRFRAFLRTFREDPAPGSQPDGPTSSPLYVAAIRDMMSGGCLGLGLGLWGRRSVWACLGGLFGEGGGWGLTHAKGKVSRGMQRMQLSVVHACVGGRVSSGRGMGMSM